MRGTHRLGGYLQVSETLSQIGRDHRRLAPGADQEQADLRRFRENLRETVFGNTARIRHRPGPDAARQAQKRTPMRHPRKAEAAIAVAVDRREPREMTPVGGSGHALTPR